MIINPFWAGVGVTLLFEALAFIGIVCVVVWQQNKR